MLALLTSELIISEYWVFEHDHTYSHFLEWYYTNLKQTDPEEYEDQDGDGILKDNEKEWIFPMDNYYRIEKITKKGKFWMVDGTNRN